MLTRQELDRKLEQFTKRCHTFDAATFIMLAKIHAHRKSPAAMRKDWVRWRSKAKLIIREVRHFRQRIQEEGNAELRSIGNQIDWNGMLPFMDGIRSRVVLFTPLNGLNGPAPRR